jgi:hypothetical protein
MAKPSTSPTSAPAGPSSHGQPLCPCILPLGLLWGRGGSDGWQPNEVAHEAPRACLSVGDRGTRQAPSQAVLPLLSRTAYPSPPAPSLPSGPGLIPLGFNPRRIETGALGHRLRQAAHRTVSRPGTCSIHRGPQPVPSPFAGRADRTGRLVPAGLPPRPEGQTRHGPLSSVHAPAAVRADGDKC